ncbi:MAG: hypothetical protein M1819_003446 [Sarea resinae]|nr:MAG: hypothetical protein M1819_003446 [Sarea resinae]
MRQVKIFSGSSHPTLVDSICERIGTTPAKCELSKFSNGETSVKIGSSVRDQDVFIVQSGSSRINDNVMELLIMISACKGGSAKSITAVMPYFPYSRQSKKKSHRGAITARMLANLLSMAGVDHVITVDLHASQMQGFFGKPVDNLFAEPLIARWIRSHVQGWKDAVVVSKNPGGTKRVTSLADALKLNFGIVTTDRRRPHNNMNGSMMQESMFTDRSYDSQHVVEAELDAEVQLDPLDEVEVPDRSRPHHKDHERKKASSHGRNPNRLSNGTGKNVPSPLARSTRVDSVSESTPPSPRLSRAHTATITTRDPEDEQSDEYTDERARDVITGRLIHGHIVDDDHPSPTISAMSASIPALQGGPESPEIAPDPMAMSFISGVSSNADHALGGTIDAAATSDEEEENFKDPHLEQTITLVGNVRDKTVFIVDDMIDKAGSWIAAAETVVKRGGAKKVYCIATHGLFGSDCLAEMEACPCIDHIVVTNSFPIPSEKAATTRKLSVLDLSNLLSEAIRRNHYGESVSQLFLHYHD